MPKERNQETAMPSLGFDLEVARDGKQPDELRLAALEGVMDKAFLSAMVILPTPGDEPVPEETRRLFEEHMQMIDDIRRATTGIVEEGKGGAPVRVKALELKNFFDVFQEAARVIAEEAAETPVPERPADPEPDDPEAPTGGDPGAGAGAAIRAGWLPFPRPGLGEEACCCMPVEPCGCGVVVKEFRGLQLVWRLRLITKTIEPWFSRRRIVRRWVWVLEWNPVQYIKTITTHCECHGKGGTSVDTRVVRDFPLMTFWRGYEACRSGHH